MRVAEREAAQAHDDDEDEDADRERGGEEQQWWHLFNRALADRGTDAPGGGCPDEGARGPRPEGSRRHGETPCEADPPRRPELPRSPRRRSTSSPGCGPVAGDASRVPSDQVSTGREARSG